MRPWDKGLSMPDQLSVLGTNDPMCETQKNIRSHLLCEGRLVRKLPFRKSLRNLSIAFEILVYVDIDGRYETATEIFS